MLRKSLRENCVAISERESQKRNHIERNSIFTFISYFKKVYYGIKATNFRKVIDEIHKLSKDYVLSLKYYFFYIINFNFFFFFLSSLFKVHMVVSFSYSMIKRQGILIIKKIISGTSMTTAEHLFQDLKNFIS
jgi:sensor histidine kinase YesM